MRFSTTPIYETTVEFTRPSNTTAYSIGDVVSNSTSATTLMRFENCIKQGGSGYVVGVTVATSKKLIIPCLRLHLYKNSNVTVANDNAAFVELYADVPDKIGYIDLSPLSTPADSSGASLSRVFETGLRVPFRAAPNSGDLYGVLEARNSFSPDSAQTFSVTIFTEFQS